MGKSPQQRRTPRRPRPEEHVLEAGSVRLNYAETPVNGPLLLCLHGLAARWQVFAPLIRPLSGEWHIIAPDFRGHGSSGHTPGAYRISDFAADTIALLRARGAAEAVLYGHSLGGWVALSVAATHPEMVRAVVVADTAIDPADIDPDAALSYLADLPLALRSLARSLQQLDPAVMVAFRSGELTAAFDPNRVLPSVRCPTLLLQADPERGGLMTDDDVSRALTLLPSATHRRFDGVGHGLHVEDAAAVLAAVSPFLASARDRT